MPPYCPGEAPPGERELFIALASAPGTDGWTALHSLAIAAHVRQVEGEADFVVIVPNHGVLVIEVKSHTTVSRLPDGRWKLGSQPPTGRSPFTQASEAKYSIRDYLIRQRIDLRPVPLIHAVWFTHARARSALPPSPEWHDWQLLDSEDLTADAAKAVLRTLQAGSNHLRTKIKGFAPGLVGPNDATSAAIASSLRRKFELAIVPGNLRRARQTQLTAFIDEQYDALDNMQQNRAVLFTGPAGTGKTWLAMEAARREAALGRTGRLLCFNRLLGRRLSLDMAGVSGLRTSTFHQEILRLTGKQAPRDASAGFWDRELPDHAVDMLLERGETEAADFLIVDEVQDLAREPFLDILDLLVKGGLRDGRVLLFGDFERQAIYDGADGQERLRRQIPHLATYDLTFNCRNLRRIGTVVKLLSHLTPGYRHYRRPDDGVDPSFLKYLRGSDQSAALADAIRVLRDDDCDLDEIVVLSPLRGRSTAETTTDPWLRQILRPADGVTAPRGRVRYSTIHAFKGLDAPAVILTDLDRAEAPNFEALLYVGLTRATDRLAVLMEEQTLLAAFGGNA
ncbi:nuclease-related domain-containing DEAD/DEAH box helicase [Pseudofrankia inefficax]|nr:ATP-binding domain-containing protein [Pseudofrankia inefficax]